MPDEKDLYGMMVKFDERQKTIFNMLARVEKHLEKLNGKVANHETQLAKMQVWGTVAVVSFPIIVNIIMRFV
jgi:hypothetical protein|tara:strand:- start:1380 stop:1595 length:216 start_codon:yes stop_codon:yes gene_type:complete